jgi:RNA 3'-terminal phosphate cyclase (ATP)
VLRQAGLAGRISYGPAGFYPEGGGVVLGSVGTSTLSPVMLEQRGKLRNLTAHIVTSRLPSHVAERGENIVVNYMKGIGRKISIERHDSGELARSTGAAVVLTAECDSGFAGFTSLGERGKPMEKVAEQACDEFMNWWKTGAAVDEHLADQLVLPMSLVHGESRWTTPEVTEHLRTVLWVVEQFLPIEYQVLEAKSGGFEVRIEGTAWRDHQKY